MNNLLEVKNLSKSFGAKRVVSDLSFEARSGEIFGLLGPNGAGKTTTIRIIATMLAPDQGTVKVAGFDTAKQPGQVRGSVGVLTAELGVYHRFSGRENLRYFGELYGMSGDKLEDRIRTLAKQLDMEDFIDQRAEGYSTGMKQKLSIARSVIHDPDLVIFDEPTSGLDVLAAQTVLKFMQEAKGRGKCVVFSTHHMHEAEKLCDRVAIIHRGRLVVSGSVASLKRNSNSHDLEGAFLSLVHDNDLLIEPAAAVSESQPVQRKRLRFFNYFGAILLLTGLALLFFSGQVVAGNVLMVLGFIMLFYTKYQIKKLDK
jgi:sodium transport system ATP-binding protein